MTATPTIAKDATVGFAMPFAAIRAADLPLVGGKGANLGELAAAGLPVPPGLCVTTAAFDRFMAGADADGIYRELALLDAADLPALRAAGAAVAATDAVIAGTVDNAFCAVRPPGHHARPTEPMGFCLFNNVA
ncbi:MAG TPA: PEP/pyruvate-binding domain-containing protein, partial [Herpetosiphonaceae bacterium]